MIWCAVLAGAPVAHSTDTAIRWLDFEQGKALAQSQNKVAVLYFHTAWCPSCKQMKAETFSHPEVIRQLNEDVVAISVDADARRDIAGAYGITGVPELWLLHPDASPIGNIAGFVPADRLLKILQYQRR